MAKDVKMSYIEDDIKKIQVKTNMYLQNYGDLGVFHIFKEPAQNAIDELEDPNTNGNHIWVSYDRLNDKVTIEDNGRGIPEEDYSIEVVCTKLQAGSKFFREQGGKSSGEFGVGVTVTNALSTHFSIATYRNKYMHKIEFEEGEKTNEERRDLTKKDKSHGTIITFISNPKYLGKGSKLPFDEVCNWFDEINHQISKGITIDVEEKNGFDTISTKKYKSKPFKEYITRVTSDTGELIGDPINFSSDGFLEEEIMDSLIDKNERVKTKKRNVRKDVHLDVVFTYQDDLITSYRSFCNFTRTDEGGVHVDSVEEVLCRFLQDKTKESMTDKEREKWPITWADVKEGMKLAINLSTNAQVDFMGNAKNKIQNEALKPLIKEIVLTNLNELYQKSPAKFQPIFRFIKANARARVEANKTRIASRRGSTSRLDLFNNPNFVTCNNKGKAYKELYVVEGKRSAAGAIINGRFSADFQAVYGFRGCTMNPYKVPLYKLMQNEEWKNFVNVLQCGIGDTFNLDKLYFDKIILGSDADIDGFFISMGICGFFVLYMPEVILDGRLYKVFPPLYKLDDKQHEFVSNKSEITEIFMKKVAKKYVIAIPGMGGLNKSELFDFLDDTSSYLDQYQDLKDYYKVNVELIELIAATLVETNVIRSSKIYDDIPTAVQNQNIVTTLMSRVQKQFDELKMVKNHINGPLEGGFASIDLNNRWPKKIDSLIPIYQKYGHQVLVTKKNSGEEPRVMTILNFLREVEGLNPNKIKRYKGLGEALPEEIERTTMDPNKRILVRLTMDDCEKALKTFWDLQGNGKENRLARKKMMEEYEISPEYIDT